MRRVGLVLLAGVLALPALASDAPLRGFRLERILPLAGALRGGFDAVEEVPLDPAHDPELREWGVVDQRARHYTRDGHRGIQVCSLEAWSFRSVELAVAAHAGIQYPRWEFARAGSVLLMVRGLTRPPGERPQRGVFPECREILARAVERAPGE